MVMITVEYLFTLTSSYSRLGTATEEMIEIFLAEGRLVSALQLGDYLLSKLYPSLFHHLLPLRPFLLVDIYCMLMVCSTHICFFYISFFSSSSQRSCRHSLCSEVPGGCGQDRRQQGFLHRLQVFVDEF